MTDETIREPWNECPICGRPRPTKYAACGKCTFRKIKDVGIRKLCARRTSLSGGPKTVLFMQVGKKWRHLEVR